MSDRPEESTDFAAALAAAADRAAAAHPAITADPAGFTRHLAVALGDPPDPIALAELHVGDLHVAYACCAGDPAAIGELERALAPVRDHLIRRGNDAALVDDALQAVRYRLLVATPQREAKLATYRGRGTLGGWLRVVALRQLRALAPARAAAADPTPRLVDTAAGADAALGVLVRTHGPLIRRMFRDALRTLDDRQRDLLRLEVLDQVPHQRIAELHGVHRTTALRWIEEARQALAREVRRRLKRELALGDDSAESLLRTLADQVELSLASGLLPTAA
jgi:RNA polymerase sigma-70 factor, ECF subfamily